MIYFTTYFFTLLLAVIARAMPTCDDAASSEDLYSEDSYDSSYYDAELVLATYKVTWDAVYDERHRSTNTVACSNGPHGLVAQYPELKDIPGFPFLGGVFDTKWGSPNCGKCWRLTDKKTKRSIHITAVDAAGTGFNIGKHAFIALNGGTVGAGTLEAEAVPVPRHHCGFK
jgi:hypothetical protein